MPIEDVDYMHERSLQDAATFLIDSGKRDRRYYPIPAEYVTEFSEPLKNVFGIDVLDASIPGTMYNVDAHNNKLRYAVFLPTPSLASGSDFVDVFSILSTSTRFMDCLVDAATNTTVSVVCADSFRLPASASVSASKTDKLLVSYQLLPTTLLEMSDGIRQALGGQARLASITSLQSQNVLWFVSRGLWYGSPDRALWAQIQSYMDLGSRDVCVLPLGRGSAGSATHDIVFTESLYLVESVPGGGDGVEWQVSFRTMRMELGNYNLASMASNLVEILFASRFEILSTSSGNYDKQNRFMFRNQSPFLLDMTASTLSEVLGFDLRPARSSGNKPPEWGSTVTEALGQGYQVLDVPPGARNAARAQQLFGSVYNASTRDHRLLAPGIVNLLGVRYLTLRCPEIEDHIHGSRSYGDHSVGVGVFKLPSPNEVANLRFDFVNLIRKPFHPIGKLSRLTFRFEFQEGVLYDFKGINHQILIALKFYSPPRAPRPPVSVLNPDYNPDYLGYLTSLADYAERNDGVARVGYGPDDGQDGPDLNQVVIEGNTWDYSTTDEDEDGDDEEDVGYDST